MKASIMNLIGANPSGLLELKPAMTIDEYREKSGFDLKKIVTIYQSERINGDRKKWFAFPSRTLENLVTIQKESESDLLVVYIVETIKSGQVYCHLLLSDEAYLTILNDKSQCILQVHQMYAKFFQDHIAVNMAN
jgi:hypothetical protein